MTALFLTDPRDDQEKLVRTNASRVYGKCEWIKANPLYKLWLPSYSQLLWMHGPSKCKIMVLIFLVEELEQSVKNSPNTLFLQYFCNSKAEKRNTAIATMRGLLLRLLELHLKLFRHILPMFGTRKESLFTDASFYTLWKIFEAMIRDPILDKIYCVLDGLDKCDSASLEELLDKFTTLLSKSDGSSTCHLNLLVYQPSSSRIYS